MSLLDGGLARIFGAAMGSVYLDATLHRIVRTPAANGDVATSATDHAAKAHFDMVDETMRQEPGYTERDVAILVLRAPLAVEPTTDDEITLGGRRWSIASVGTDPAGTHWRMRGQAA